ncbi:MAG: 2-aminoethylphosphonate--pyruvate transaminase [Proteobacteria bacterium]|nr:2-aminoethylphosphonate--pyruvate transaminase [Pseudomonadota bacterium]MDA1023099.1 2-aminoethylphosphonate--pyruvate transaminase [Pseudomonadota bacterium]
MTKTVKDPWLLTPGPLTTSARTKEAMLHDWGSRDVQFIETNKRVRERLLAIAGAEATHVCVPLQGSGTFAVEATLGTMIAKNGTALILINGAYGHRMAKILDYAGRRYEILETPEDTPPDLDALGAALKTDPGISHVLAVYCETTSGILNPIADIARITAEHDRSLLIDAMSAFGALPMDAKNIPFDALMASSNKCLEGVPGMGFALIRQSALEKCQGNAHALSLDLYDQWTAMDKNGQWRFTPPTHVIAAFDAAIDQFEAEGGVSARHTRYSNNGKILIDGMRALGFETLLPDDLQAPIIVTFKMPADKAFDFQAFYDALGRKGYVIYPGKLTVAPSFRIGCIGHLDETVMTGALDAIRQTLKDMGVTSGAPEI